jgi:hypothetical protein
MCVCVSVSVCLCHFVNANQKHHIIAKYIILPQLYEFFICTLRVAHAKAAAAGQASSARCLLNKTRGSTTPRKLPVVSGMCQANNRFLPSTIDY